MQPKTKALAAAASGTAIGITGLAIVAMPAGAGEAPELPEITAEKLVESTLSAQPPAFAGEVTVDNSLGLPAIPGMDAANFDSARVFHDGGERARLSVERGSSEYTIVKDDKGLWRYDSDSNTATRTTWTEADRKAMESARPEHADEAELSDPAQAATRIIGELEKTSEITVDGTARVADRAAYELVLTPKPSERTLLREVRVAIDDETRVPLRFEVLPNGSTDPVVSLAFSEFTVGEQPESLFSFTPPKGAEVETDKPGDARPEAEHEQEVGDSLSLLGDGWDTVVTGELPAGTLTGESGESGEPGDNAANPRDLLEQAGERIDGDFGSGYLITTRAGGGILTDDGRFAAGAVPKQVLIEALEER